MFNKPQKFLKYSSSGLLECPAVPIGLGIQGPEPRACISNNDPHKLDAALRLYKIYISLTFSV